MIQWQKNWAFQSSYSYIYINPKRYGSYSDGLKRSADIDGKYLEKAATFYDMCRQQNRFFNEHKEDEFGNEKGMIPWQIF